jgi:flagellar protein FliT
LLSPVQELLNLSKEFYGEINEPFQKNERDVAISKIKEFLLKRDGLIKKLVGPHTTEERLLGEQVLVYDHKIEAKFKALKQEISEDLLTLRKQKKSTSKFINPYQSTFVNGVFLDKHR